MCGAYYNSGRFCTCLEENQQQQRREKNKNSQRFFEETTTKKQLGTSRDCVIVCVCVCVWCAVPAVICATDLLLLLLFFFRMISGQKQNKTPQNLVSFCFEKKIWLKRQKNNNNIFFFVGGVGKGIIYRYVTVGGWALSSVGSVRRRWKKRRKDEKKKRE